MTPLASVIIPVFNRPELLKNTVNAIENQNFDSKKFEVILVFGFNKKTEKLCKEFSKNTNFYCFKSPSESPSVKRNIGIKKANGKIIVFTDDDCLPEKNWLKEMLIFFNDKNIAGVEGLTYTKGPSELYSNAPINLKGDMFPTCNISFRKNVLEKIGGFDENFNFYREDSDIAFRAMEHGEIIFADKAKVYHPQRKVSLLRPINTLNLLKEDIRLIKKSPEKYKKYLGKTFALELIKAAVPWFFGLAFVFSATLSGTAMAGVIIADFIFWGSRIMDRKASIFEVISYVLLMNLRGLLFPFLFLYYWFTIK